MIGCRIVQPMMFHRSRSLMRDRDRARCLQSHHRHLPRAPHKGQTGLPALKRDVDEDSYPHPPLELTADTDERFVAHSAGAVSKLVQMAVLNASGVREPAYFTPLINIVGDAVAL